MMASPERKTPCQRTAYRVGVTISLALAEAAAILVLRKQLRDYYGITDEDD